MGNVLRKQLQVFAVARVTAFAHALPTRAGFGLKTKDPQFLIFGLAVLLSLVGAQSGFAQFRSDLTAEAAEERSAVRTSGPRGDER